MNPTPSNPHALVPKVLGADCELGNFITGGSGATDTTLAVSRALLSVIRGVSAQRAQAACATELRSAGTPANSEEDQDSFSQDWGRRFLANGGCAYVDLNHLEVCVPELRSARDHVACCHAMYRLASQAADTLNARLPSPQKLWVLANNSDGQDHSYGSHLNLLISRTAFRHLFHYRLHYQLFLASYQASSIVFTGLGKVGGENGETARYQISQRADFFEMLTGPQTTYHRPLINSRDESLCGSPRFATTVDAAAENLARLHVIFYDHNLCHGAAFLKAGVLQLILALIEAEQVDPDLLLADPVDTVKRWSHDPTLRARGPLLSGRLCSAVELQWRFLEQVRPLVESGVCDAAVPEARAILALWADTLDKLEQGRFEALRPRLDWVLKWSLLRQTLERHPELSWASPELKHLDHLYSDLDPQSGLFYACERSQLIERWAAPERIEWFLRHPPADTRAYTRAALLCLSDPETIERVDWDEIWFRHPLDRSSPRQGCWRLSLAHPLRHTKAEFQLAFERTRDYEQLLQLLATPPPSTALTPATLVAVNPVPLIPASPPEPSASGTPAATESTPNPKVDPHAIPPTSN